MNIYCYPDDDNFELPTDLNYKDIENGPIKRFFKDLEKKSTQLWALTKIVLKKAEKIDDLKFFEKNGYVGNLTGTKDIYEFRIPPQKKGGVVRIYFGYKKGENQTIVLLSAEIKKGKSADPLKIKQAEDRYKEVCI